ncbi:hypothetical protein TSOC_003858 [Tetrabaena socialis]|uniref:Right handed beta helix domain-containing protein n=1 Tax=Tetrabaena socialis TaxID=47790 RepID=A0A2J8AAM5_9CHLO|nr:hypothetical protein TSOC_003858 [Tetrabaena socialis]|eukprot:PNH09523.1 hypothetical protein TSOC_003858 [Tetrabaena socialis]
MRGGQGRYHPHKGARSGRGAATTSTSRSPITDRQSDTRGSICGGQAAGPGGSDNFSSSEAGGATITRCEAVLKDLQFRNNSAARAGGALYLKPSDKVTTATLRNVSFSGNNAQLQAGALLMSGWHSPATLFQSFTIFCVHFSTMVAV